MTRAGVVVFGDTCLHVTVRPSSLDDFCAGEVELTPGGSAAMVAWQVAAVGWPVTMAGVAGTDDLATDLRARLEGAGVDCSRWTSVPGRTARVAILVDPDGGHRVVVEQGEITEPGRVLATAMDSDFGLSGKLCYIPGFPAYDEARTMLVERRANVVSDFGFRPWLTDLDTARANILSRVAGVSLAVCSGASLSESDNHALARACLDAGASAVVTSLGSNGCLVSDGSDTVLMPGFAAKPVNTLGAGDSLVAGLLVAMSQGRPIAQACVYAQAVAAAKIETLARPAAPAAVQEFLKTVGWS
jgi:sugar/nucleoside kinase (ribokinase family)